MAITKVQTAGFSPPAVTEYSTAGMSNFAVGDLLTVNFGASHNARISTLSGGGVSLWVKAVQAINPEDTEDSAEIWYGFVTSGGVNNVITVNWTVATSFFDPLVVCEWAGVGALDKTSVNTGKSATMASAAATPTSEGDLFLAIGRLPNLTVSGTATGGWTELSAAGHGGNRSAFVVAAGSGEEATSWTLSGTDYWAVAMASFTAYVAPVVEPAPKPTLVNRATVTNPFSYYAYDLLSGRFLGQLPLRGVQFGQQLNTPGQLSGTLDLQDPRIQKTEPLSCTVPNRTVIVVDFAGSVMWAGIVMTRKWKVESSGSSTTAGFEISCSEMWCYFQQRVQATDYSSPPYSGITGVGEMSLWKATPWDSSLIACQVISDAIGYADSSSQPYGDPLGGMTIHLNGEAPSGSKPAAPSTDWVAVNYPFTSCQTVDTIVTQLSQLGLGVGFDFGVDVSYMAGSASPLIGVINISYPRRGRMVAENHLAVDLTTARGYEFPEDGTQTANQVYEIGGSGAIEVSENVSPLEQGYPIWERVISRANAQSQNIESLLAQTGLSDLVLYSYPPVTPTVTLGVSDPNLPLGSFIVGDDVEVMIPEAGPNGQVFDPRFSKGWESEWRITSWTAEVADEGDAKVKLALAAPPYLQALSPTI